MLYMYKDNEFHLSEQNRVLHNRFLAFRQCPVGFREVREAFRNHFHLSWYVSVPGITSYGQKPSWGEFVLLSPVQKAIRYTAEFSRAAFFGYMRI